MHLQAPQGLRTAKFLVDFIDLRRVQFDAAIYDEVEPPNALDASRTHGGGEIGRGSAVG